MKKKKHIHTGPVNKERKTAKQKAFDYSVGRPNKQHAVPSSTVEFNANCLQRTCSTAARRPTAVCNLDAAAATMAYMRSIVMMTMANGEAAVTDDLVHR